MDNTQDLFREAMNELRTIKEEIVKLNTSLVITIERQIVANEKAQGVERRVESLEKHFNSCPSRISYNSKSNIVKEYSALLALILSAYALFKAFF